MKLQSTFSHTTLPTHLHDRAEKINIYRGGKGEKINAHTYHFSNFSFWIEAFLINTLPPYKHSQQTNRILYTEDSGINPSISTYIWIFVYILY